MSKVRTRMRCCCCCLSAVRVVTLSSFALCDDREVGIEVTDLDLAVLFFMITFQSCFNVMVYFL
jgi:hypothetical protein